LHGGAPSRAVEMIDDIGDPDNTERWLAAQDPDLDVASLRRALAGRGSDPTGGL